MNAGPISMNAPGAASLNDATSAPAAKSAGLPAFAQVLAEKQSSAPAPGADSAAANSAAKNAQPPAANASSKTPPAAPASPTAASDAPPTVSAQQPAAAAPRKTDAKSKSSADAQPAPAAATVAASGATAAMLALLPVVNPVAIQVPPPAPGTKSAVSSAQAPATVSDPAIAISSPDLLSPQTQGQARPEPQQAPAQPSSSEILSHLPSLPLAKEIPSLPTADSVVGTTVGKPLAGDTSNTSEPQPASSNVATASAASTPLPPQATTAPVETPSPTDLPPLPLSDAAYSSPVPDVPSAGHLAASDPGDPAKAAVAAFSARRGSVAEILRGFASVARKTAETVAHVSANTARDVVSAIQEKSATGKSSPAAAVPPNVAAKIQSSPHVKQESAANSATQATPKAAPAKDIGTSGDSPDDDSAKTEDEATASAGINVRTKTFGVEAASSPAAPPAPGSATNTVAPQIGSIASLAAGKEPALGSKPASANDQSSDAAAPLDPDDSRLPALDSKAVNVAQLTGNDAHSEVRIAMQADQLGQVELHATLSGQQIGAAITVEKKEAHAALAVELPSLQQALEEKNLRVSEVVLTQGAMHSTSGDAGRGSNAPSEQHPNPIARQYQKAQPEPASSGLPAASLVSPGIFDGYGRLSVRV